MGRNGPKLACPKWIWTTFSEDQIDLNFRNPEVLLQVIESVLFYIRHGADILRLDAVTYLWDEPGTEGVHLPQIHEVIKLLRDIVDAVGLGVALLTETNVPHQLNISYMGDGRDEAHMVYNFALPPLVLHTFYREDTRALSRWAEKLSPLPTRQHTSTSSTRTTASDCWEPGKSCQRRTSIPLLRRPGAGAPMSPPK
jgi:sucrose phosphorylase